MSFGRKKGRKFYWLKTESNAKSDLFISKIENKYMERNVLNDVPFFITDVQK